MRAKILLLVCAGLVACFLFIGARGFERTTWEYKVVPTGMSDLQDPLLNNLGAQGWELTSITYDTDRSHQTYYFKRPK
jgi:hypothetical protein